MIVSPYIITLTACSNKHCELIFVEANPEIGYNYTYFLFIQEGIAMHEKSGSVYGFVKVPDNLSK